MSKQTTKQKLLYEIDKVVWPQVTNTIDYRLINYIDANIYTMVLNIEEMGELIGDEINN